MSTGYISTVTGRISAIKSLFSDRAPRRLSISDRLSAARECDMVELDKREIMTSKVTVEPGRQYEVSVKVASDSARPDAAMLTFSVDVPLTPEDAVKYFPRFTPAVGKPFVFLPTQNDGQDDRLWSVRFTAPPGARHVTIAGRRWASDGDVKIGKCLAMQIEGAPAGPVHTTRCDLPGGRFCELVIDAARLTHLTAVEVFTATVSFRDAQQRQLTAGEQAFRCAAYPAAPREAALALPLEVPADAAGMTVGITAADRRLPGALQIALRALGEPQDVAGFIGALKERLDRRTTAIRQCAAAAVPGSKDEVDEWCCSEKAAVLQRAAALFGPKPESGASSKSGISLPVVPGTILEIRLVPVLVPALREPCAATLSASFLDADGKALPHAGNEASWSQWTRHQYPLSFESEAFDRQGHFAADHYIVVPPRSASLAVDVSGAADGADPQLLVQTVTVYDDEVGKFIERAIACLEERSAFLKRLAQCLPADLESAIGTVVADEHQACAGHLRVMSGFLLSAPDPRIWPKANATTSFDIEGLPRQLPDAALDAGLLSVPASKLRVGVVGSRDFIYCLSVWHQVTPLTPDVAAAAATVLPLDLVVLEQSDRLSGGWPQAFFGHLDGAIPQTTLDFVRSLRQRGVPVVLVADPSPAFLRLIGSWADEVDRLVISGLGGEDERVAAALGDRPNLVRFPLLVETRLHRPIIEERQATFNVLYSSMSDLFDFRGNLEYLERIVDGGLMITDRHWRLVLERVKRTLQSPRLTERIFGSASTEQWAVLCRHSAVALFFEDSLLPPHKATQVMAEAIANGAVAVYVGDPGRLGELADIIIAVQTPYQLSLMLRQLRFGWHREQVWLRAFRRLHRQFRFERFATWLQTLVSADAPAEPAVPRATMITISKRPHLLDYCISKFRHQSYANLELVLILNTDSDDAALAEAAAGEPRVRVYKVPKEFNIGYCLNMAIACATGEIWLKCDDDDFYGPHYVEDMVNAFHFSGADIVGKPQWYTYFQDRDEIHVPIASGRVRERSVLRPPVEFLTGATLSARTRATIGDNVWFSSTVRMGNDSEWVRAAVERGLTLFFSDCNNFAIYRSADLGDHTWSVSSETLRKWSVPLVAGPRYDLFC